MIFIHLYKNGNLFCWMWMAICVVALALISIYYTGKLRVGISPAANCEAKEETVSRRHQTNIDETGSRYFQILDLSSI